MAASEIRKLTNTADMKKKVFVRLRDELTVKKCEIQAKNEFEIQTNYIFSFLIYIVSEDIIQGRKLLIIRRFWPRKLVKGGNYSRAETIRGNTVYDIYKYIPKFFEFAFQTMPAIPNKRQRTNGIKNHG